MLLAGLPVVASLIYPQYRSLFEKKKNTRTVRLTLTELATYNTLFSSNRDGKTVNRVDNSLSATCYISVYRKNELDIYRV